MAQARLLLGVTIGLEICATTSMKLASKDPRWHVGTVCGYCACFSIFPRVLRTIPLGVAYAIWSGVGLAATCCVSAALFKETFNAKKIFALLTIVLGVVGLELS